VTGNFDASYSIVQGLLSDLGGGSYPGSSEANPEFVDLAVGDFRLRATSPAIDAGNNDQVPPTTVTDLDGSARFADAPDVPDTGAGTPPIVDIGAFEFGAQPPPAVVDLLVTMTDSPAPVAVGEVLTYTIPVTNLGALTADQVQFTDILPPGVTLRSVTTTLGSCTAAPTVYCSLGALGGGDSATVTVQVTPTVAGTIGNTASVDTTSAETDLANNTATALTRANAPVPRCTGGIARLTVTTVDENRQPIVGASVRIVGPNGCSSTASTSTTGAVQFVRLPKGSYTVAPTEAGRAFAPRLRTLTLTTRASARFIGDGCN
jgi:uncharacterized repeat protein (TIGR01451 family)